MKKIAVLILLWSTATFSYIHGENEQVNKADPVEESFEALSYLLSVLSFGNGKMNHGAFRVDVCDPRPYDWVLGVLQQSDVSKSYAFSDRCDITGSFTASFKNEFPVEFKIRNLKNYTSTSMTVKMSTSKERNYRYQFEVIKGQLKSAEQNVEFRAKYEIDVDSTTGNALFPTQKGEVTIDRINGKTIGQSKELRF